MSNLQPYDSAEIQRRLRQSWRDSAFTCSFIYLAGWVSGADSIPVWIAFPAAASLAILEAGLMRRRLEALMTARNRMIEVHGLLEDAEQADDSAKESF